MKRITRFIHSFIILLLLLHPGLMPGQVSAQSDALPDLAIVDDLVFSSPRMINRYLDVTVVIRNLGGDAPESTVTLNWCCGTVTKTLESLVAGEYREVKFENVLYFQDAGLFTIGASVDSDGQISESDEENNQRLNDIEIALTPIRYTTEGSEWSQERSQHGCADVDLMKIGRVDNPYVREDSDRDGVLDRLIREPFPCSNDYFDPSSNLYSPNNPLCLIYKRGQRKTACGTTSLAYTLQYFGIDVSPDDVDAEIRFHEERMFSDPLSLRDYARFKGLNAEIYIDGSVEDIKSYTDRGIPVLLNIYTVAGSNSVLKGHWVVALSVCQDDTANVGGVPPTTIVFYDPNGRQFSITPSHLYDYWDTLYLGYQALWTRLYIPITYETLAPGNTGEISTRLVIARGVAQGGVGAQDFYEGSPLEGTVEMTGGAITALLAFIGLGIEYGSDVPFIGGFLNATGEYIADVSYALSEITQGAADLLNGETWTDINKLGEAVWDIIRGVGLLIYETLEYVFDLIVEGVWGLLKDIGAWFVEIGCAWFDVGCKQTVVHYKHNASRDPCMESTAFLNNYARNQQLGYLYTEPGADTLALYLYADPFQGENDSLSDTDRKYYLCNHPNWAEDDPKLLYLGLFGYASAVDPGGYLNLSDALNAKHSKKPNRVDAVDCDLTNAYGYVLPTPTENTSPLYVMNRLVLNPFDLTSLTNENYPFSLDLCFDTETFFNEYAEGYTRETVIGKILLSPVDGTIPLHRAYRSGVVDFMFYTDPAKILPGFEEQGILGYVFSEQVEGTVPLYQYYYQGRDDHLLTLHPYAEGLPGYKDQEILGYIYPPDFEESSCCMVPLYRFCKRREIQE